MCLLFCGFKAVVAKYITFGEDVSHTIVQDATQEGSAKMTRLIAAMIRHGNYHQPVGVPSAHLPHPLNPEGEGQALEAVKGILAHMAQHELQLAPVIYTSALLRAWQTATILQQELQRSCSYTLSIEEDMALAERGLGTAANLTLDEIEAVVAKDPRCASPLPLHWKAQSRFRLPLPGAESLIDAGQRVADFISAKALAHQEQAREPTLLLFIGHGGAFRHAAYHMNILALEDIPGLSMYHCDPLYIELEEGATWRHQAGAWKVRPVAAAKD